MGGSEGKRNEPLLPCHSRNIGATDGTALAKTTLGANRFLLTRLRNARTILPRILVNQMILLLLKPDILLRPAQKITFYTVVARKPRASSAQCWFVLRIHRIAV